MSLFANQLDTPALIIDLDVMERNIERTAALARTNGVTLRPHIKTHKSPWIAKKQLEAGAQGLTAAKLSEAEVMIAEGINDILVAFPIVGEAKLKRLEALAYNADIKVSLDDPEVAKSISQVGQRLGRKIPIYLEVDTGLQRVGVPRGAASVELAAVVARMPGVEVRGVMTHGGHVGAAQSLQQLERMAREQAEVLVDTAHAMRDAGIDIQVVSPGSTLAAPFEATTPGVTEIRPGTYVFNDANTVRRWMASEAECAAWIITTVVSHAASDRAVIDAGSKTFSSDANISGIPSMGIVKGFEGVRFERASEEHGMLKLEQACDLKIGDRLAIIPNHICVAVNLSDVMYGVRRDTVELEIPVAARGKRL